MTTSLKETLQASLQAIDSEIATLIRARESLSQILGGETHEATSCPEPPPTLAPKESAPGKPQPAVATMAPAGKAWKRILKLLGEGPKSTEEIGQSLGVELPTIRYHLRNHPECVRKGGNRLAPWELTEEGRRLAIESRT